MIFGCFSCKLGYPTMHWRSKSYKLSFLTACGHAHKVANLLVSGEAECNLSSLTQRGLNSVDGLHLVRAV